MIYLESGLDSNSAINSISDFDSASESDSDSDSKSDSSPAFMNLYTHIFLLCIYTLLNKPADNFLIYSHNRINSYASNASIMHIFF